MRSATARAPPSFEGNGLSEILSVLYSLPFAESSNRILETHMHTNILGMLPVFIMGMYNRRFPTYMGKLEIPMFSIHSKTGFLPSTPVFRTRSTALWHGM